MTLWNIYRDSHRGLINSVEAKSEREALDIHFDQTAYDGERRTIRQGAMVITSPQGVKRRYYAKRA